jgi:hypothetical protein
MMAMGNTYGVLLITVLMGNGLVGLPKRLWIMGNSDEELQRLYISVQSMPRDLIYHLTFILRLYVWRRPIRTVATSSRTASSMSTRSLVASLL